MDVPSYDVFVSYQRSDRRLAQRVVRLLQSLGWSVYWDALFPAGEEYQAHLKRALEQSRSIVVLWTQRSLKSEFVLDEASYGLRRRVLVSVVVGEIELPDMARGVQYIAWPSWRDPPHSALVELIDAIARKHGTLAPSTGTLRLPAAQRSARPVYAVLALAALLAAALLFAHSERTSRPIPVLVISREPSQHPAEPAEPQPDTDIKRALLADGGAMAAAVAATIVAPEPNAATPRSPDSPAAPPRGGKTCAATAAGQARASAQQALIEGRYADAERELDRACDCRDALGCFRLGKLLHRGDGSKGWDHPHALQAYRRACELGHGGACEGAANLYLHNDVLSSDPSVMVALFKRACELELGNACAQMGRFHDRGLGVIRDAALARAHYERACVLDSGNGCLLLAGELRNRDPAKATELYEKACELQNAESCFQAGRRGRDKAEPGSEAAAKAARMLDRACALGHTAACQERD